MAISLYSLANSPGSTKDNHKTWVRSHFQTSIISVV